MRVDYRPVPDDRREEFGQFLHYAFQPEQGPVDESDDEEWPVQPGDRRGLYDGDDLLAVCRHLWFTARIRGEWRDLAGLSAVASPPENRHGGLVRQLLRESLAEYRDRDVLYSALWPFKRSFYRKYGWGTVSRYATHDCPPEQFAFAAERVDADAGRFRRLDADDHERLAEVLAADGEEFAFAVRRSEMFWRRRIIDNWMNEPYVYGWERSGDADGSDRSGSDSTADADSDADLRGYVVYTVEETDDGKQFVARELAARDHEARLQLYRFVYGHESQVDSVRLRTAPGVRLLDDVDDPSELDCEIHAGPMFRLVDAPAALEALDYPADLDGSLTLSVDDPLADWNDGTFEVGIADGAATCERVGERDSDSNPDSDADVRATVNAVSQLYAGYRSIAEVERSGDLSVERDRARDLLAAAFPPERTYLREGF